VRVRHVVITRLNLALDFAAGRERLDPGWLEARLGPFERFCHPSMLVQRAPHDWLVLVDAQTPTAIRARLDALPGFVTVALTQPHTAQALGAALGDHVDLGGATHLMTTRLDSDDALGDRHLEIIQRHARALSAPEFLNVPVGYRTHAGRHFACVDPANPFLSLVEPLDGRAPPRTAYCVAHPAAATVAPVRQVWTRPLWLQVIHDDNEVSALTGLRRPWGGVPHHFRAQPQSARATARDGARDLVRSAGYARRAFILRRAYSQPRRRK